MASTLVPMFVAVTLVVVIHVTLKLVPDVNCDSAIFVVCVIDYGTVNPQNQCQVIYCMLQSL